MLNIKQQTIQKSVTLSGVGLHTGVQTTMTFMPAKPNHGIKFQRTDLPGSPVIDADCDNVVDVSRGTTIEQSGAKVSTIEHTLAALVGLEIDNVLIQLDGPECPDVLAHVWAWYLELASARGAGGFGPGAIGYADIDAWARRTLSSPSAHEVGVLRALDQVYMEVQAAEKKGKA